MSDPRFPDRQVFVFQGRTERSRRSHPRRKPNKLFLPIWDSLEERRLLSTMTWVNSSGGDWDNPANWVNESNSSDHHVPTSSDDAVIDYSGITVTFSDGDSDSVNSLTSEATLAFSAGSLTIAAASQIENLTMSGGTLTASGGLSIEGTTTWSGGTLGGSVTNAGSMTVSSGPVYLAGTLTNASTLEVDTTISNSSDGAIVNSGTLQKTEYGGTIYLEVPVTDTGAIESDTGVLGLYEGGSVSGGTIDAGSSGEVDLYGTWSGTLQGSGGGVVLLEPGFTADTTGVTLDYPGSMLQWTSGTITGPITNAGTLTVAAGSNKYLSGTLTNAGTLEVDDHILASSGGSIVNSGTLEKTVGTGTVDVEVPVSDSGTIEADAGVLGLYEGGSVSGGTIDAGSSGEVDLYGTWSGTLQGSGGGVVLLEPGFTADTTGVTLDYPGSMLQWTSGTITGPITNAGTLTVAAGSNKYLSGTLTNAGTLEVNDHILASSGGSIVNSGTLEKTVGTGTVDVEVPVSDSGTIEADAGGLYLYAGGSGSNGVINTGANGIVYLGGSYSGSFSGSGGGTVQLVGGFTGTSGGVALDFTGSTLQWPSGTLGGVVTNAGTLTVAGSNYLFLTGTLTNTGTVNVTSSSYPIYGEPTTSRSTTRRAPSSTSRPTLACMTIAATPG